MDKNHQNKKYIAYVKKHAGKSPVLPDCLRAFISGGLICAFGQCLYRLYIFLSCTEDHARLLVSVTLIFLTALLTGLGIFDKLAKISGAGTLVPITGFANAVVSPAIDTKNEGLIMGLGAKIFTVAGPVILYGTVASVIYGIIYRLFIIL